MDAYGIAVRSGSITPQINDEIYFREKMGLPSKSTDVDRAWKDDDGVRRPVTLKSKTEIDQAIDDQANPGDSNDSNP